MEGTEGFVDRKAVKGKTHRHCHYQPNPIAGDRSRYLRGIRGPSNRLLSERPRKMELRRLGDKRRGNPLRGRQCSKRERAGEEEKGRKRKNSTKGKFCPKGRTTGLLFLKTVLLMCKRPWEGAIK